MRNLVPITRPMGAADLTQAAEDAGKLVDRTHARGNRFTREQIRDALQWMLGKTHTAF